MPTPGRLLLVTASVLVIARFSAGLFGSSVPLTDVELFPSWQIDNNAQTFPRKYDATGGDPVVLSTGNIRIQETDLRIKGRGIDFTFARTYRNGTGFSSSLGEHWDFNWNKKIVLEFDQYYVPPWSGPGGGAGPLGPSGPSSQSLGGGGPGEPIIMPVIGAFYYDGAGNIEHFEPDTLEDWTTPKGMFCKLKSYGTDTSQYMSVDPPDSFVMRDRTGLTYTFDVGNDVDHFHAGLIYRIAKVEDRKGNALHVTYKFADTAADKYVIDKIYDSLGRAVTFIYNGNGKRLKSVTDFDGRKVKYQFNARRDLINVVSPAVVGDPAGNDYPGGKAIHYNYGAAGSALQHSVVSVVDGQEWQNGAGSKTPYLVNTYNALATRVIRQSFGGVGGTNPAGIPAGGTFVFLDKGYAPGQEPDWGWFTESQRVLKVDPNGNCQLVLFDEDGYDRLIYVFTGRLDPDLILDYTDPDTLVSVSPGAPDPLVGGLIGVSPLRSGDPKSYVTRKYFNDNSLVTTLDAPGAYVDYFYYAGPDLFQKGNAYRIDRSTTKPDGLPDISSFYIHEPYFNGVRAAVDPRGMDPGFLPPNGGTADPDRYLTEYFFDYQESEIDGTPLATQASDWGIDEDQASVFANLPTGLTVQKIGDSDNLGEINGDSTTQAKGNVILSRAPSPQVYVDPADPLSSFQNQLVETTFVYNDFSLLKSISDPRQNATNLEYYAEIDPDGDGVATPEELVPLDGAVGPNGGGFLQKSFRPESVVTEYTYDPLGRPATVTNGRGYTRETTYNSLDQLVHAKDARAYESWLLYGWSNNPIETRRSNVQPDLDGNGIPTGTESAGPVLVSAFEYDILNQRLTSDRPGAASGRIVARYRYDKAGSLVLVLTPEFASDTSEATSTVYDERGLILSTTRGGLTSLFRSLQAHAQIPELTTVTDDPGASTRLTGYDDAGRAVSVTDGEGNTHANEYDGFNRLIRSTDPVGNYSTSDWDPASQRVAARWFDPADAELREVLYSHDELGRRYEKNAELYPIGVAVSIPDGPLSPGDGYVTSRSLYDSNGRKETQVDDNLVITTWEYDGLNRVTKQTDALGNEVAYTYDEAGNLIKTVEHELDSIGVPSGDYSTWLFYDELNRSTITVDNIGQARRQVWDSRNNTVFTSDANGPVTMLLSDLDPSLPAIAINDHGNTLLHVYDDADRLTSTTRHMRVGGVGGAPLDASQAGDGLITTSRTYDTNSRLKSRTDDNSNATSYAYDALGRRLSTTLADGTSESLTYDRNHNLDIRVDANGTIIDLDYDDANRLLGKTITIPGGSSHVGGTTWEQYAYDGLDRVTLAQDDDSTVSRAYDSLGRIVREVQNGEVVTAIRDGVGNLQSLDYPGMRSTDFGYDGLNRLRSIQDTGTGTNLAEYTYVGPSRVDHRDYVQSGTTLKLQYDLARRVTNMAHEVIVPTTTILDETYTWDRESNRTSRSEVVIDASHTFAYDSAYQLIQADHWQGGVNLTTVAYALDGVTNRGVVTGGYYPGSYSLDPGDDLVNQYTSAPDGPSTTDARLHDDNGNLIQVASSNVASIVYDYKNQMVEYADQTANLTHTYAYDAFGRRFSKTVDLGGGTETTTFYYWGFQCIEERDWLGNQTSFVYGSGIDEVLSMRRGGVDYFYHGDDLGNVLAITDALGQLVTGERYEYDDYGMLLDPTNNFAPHSGTGIGNPYLFQGRRFDAETGLYYFRTRYLEPRTGRFTVRDPLGIWGDSANLGSGHGFLGNNPWTFTDPLGLARQTWHGTSIYTPPDGSGEGAIGLGGWEDILNPRPSIIGSPYGGSHGQGVVDEMTSSRASIFDPNYVAATRPLDVVMYSIQDPGMDGREPSFLEKLFGFSTKIDLFLDAVREIPKSLGDAAKHVEGFIDDHPVFFWTSVILLDIADGPAPELSFAAYGRQAANVTFRGTAAGVGHGARHLPMGLSRGPVESAIRTSILGQTRNSMTSVGQSFWGRVGVQGQTVEYRAFQYSAGEISVGTYYAPK